MQPSTSSSLAVLISCGSTLSPPDTPASTRPVSSLHHPSSNSLGARPPKRPSREVTLHRHFYPPTPTVLSYTGHVSPFHFLVQCTLTTRAPQVDRDDPSASNVPHIPKFDTKWSPEEDLLPCTSQPPQSDSSSNKKVPAKPNPIIAWRVSKKTITDISVSPDPNNPGRYLAASSLDGALRIIDLVEQRLLDAYASYFGGLNCVCWSPDGHYVLVRRLTALASQANGSTCRLAARTISSAFIRSQSSACCSDVRDT